MMKRQMPKVGEVFNPYDFFQMGSCARTVWVVENLFKRLELSDSEKLILLALADSPATEEWLIENYNLNCESTPRVLEGLLVKKLIRYCEAHPFRSPYTYEIALPED